ncbi:MAG TPA: hypothetical protein VJ461_03715 [Candidatus Nanoarchaeia archaeon]|nr:hypothetical protein [Candidatus Nanoarchaeia archaeon]
MEKVVYIIGALKNWKVIDLANKLSKEFPKCEFFCSWITPGPEADEYLRKYGKKRGLNYKETLQDWGAKHVFDFDKTHLNRSDIVIMLMPCGKSGHLELGYSIGKGKLGYVLFPKEPKRIDVMYQFAADLFFNTDDLIGELRKVMNKPSNDGAPVIRRKKMNPVVVWTKAQENR